MGWMIQGLNPGGSEIFWTHPDWPQGPPSFLYSGYRVSFPGVKRLGHSVDNHSPPVLVPRLSMGRAIHLPPLCACLACYTVTFTFYILLLSGDSICCDRRRYVFHPCMLHRNFRNFLILKFENLTTLAFQVFIHNPSKLTVKELMVKI